MRADRAEKTPLRLMDIARLALEWLLALLIAGVALFIFLNGSFFSSYNAWHIDLSINLTAAHALRDGANPYGPTALFERAEALGSPTLAVYDQLYTSYIQPPTSALSLTPLTTLPWRDATHAYLYLNHVLLFVAIGVTLMTIKPTLPLHWVIAGTAVLLALYACIPFSFALGQVDPTLMLLLSIGFWGYTRDKPAVAGTAIACAAAIKLIPGLLLLYFLFKREYRVVFWGAGAGLAIFLLSLALVDIEIYRTYLTETLPALTKGSTHYSNAALTAIVARSATPDVISGMPEMIYLGEVASGQRERLLITMIQVAGLLAIASLAGFWRRREPPGESRIGLVSEYYFVVAVGLLISSSTWDFYVIWLLPVFLAVLFAPRKVLPSNVAARGAVLAVMGLVLAGFNFPGDLYLFGPNDFFYHPEWVPGKWVEDRVLLYHKHLDAVIFLRLPSLLLMACTLAVLALLRRKEAIATRPARLPIQAVEVAEAPARATAAD